MRSYEGLPANVLVMDWLVGKERSVQRRVGAVVVAGTLAMSMTACSGDDEKSKESSPKIDYAGPETPREIAGLCPLTAKQVGKWVGEKVKGKRCTFAAADGVPTIAIVPTIAAETDEFASKRKEFEKAWSNSANIDGVRGDAYVVWSDDELNAIVGYRDNLSGYRMTVTALTPGEVSTDDVPGMAKELIDMVVAKRPKATDN